MATRPTQIHATMEMKKVIKFCSVLFNLRPRRCLKCGSNGRHKFGFSSFQTRRGIEKSCASDPTIPGWVYLRNINMQQKSNVFSVRVTITGCPNVGEVLSRLGAHMLFPVCVTATMQVPSYTPQAMKLLENDHMICMQTLTNISRITSFRIKSMRLVPLLVPIAS